MKKLFILAFILITVEAKAQLKDPTTLKVTKEFTDTVKGKSISDLKKYYLSKKNVTEFFDLSEKTFQVQCKTFFILGMVRSNYIQLSYYPNDEVCGL